MEYLLRNWNIDPSRVYAQGLSDSETEKLLVLDIRPSSYFSEHGMSSENAGGGVAAYEEPVMSWLFFWKKQQEQTQRIQTRPLL